LATRFFGGLNPSPTYTISRPLVELTATSHALTFSLRFGLGHIWKPWVVTKEEVAGVKVTVAPLFGSLRIRIHMIDGRLWTFWANSPEAVIPCLQQLGYPVTLPQDYRPLW
jgi:hypothetical protein